MSTSRFLGWTLAGCGLLVCVIVGGGAAVAFSVNSSSITSAPLVSAPPVLETGIGAVGRLEPGWKVLQVSTGSANDGGRIQGLFVEEGQLVQSGQQLVTLDTYGRKKAGLAEAKALLQVAQAKLALTLAGPKQTDIQVQADEVELRILSHQNAESQFRRMERLTSAKAGTAESLELSKLEFERAGHLVDQARGQLTSLRTIRPEDVQMAEAEVAKATASVQRAEEELAATVIQSPISGRILKIHSRPGERAAESGILEIGDTSQMQAVAEVYEADASRLKIGQTASVNLLSHSDPLSGKVVAIGWKVGRKVVFDNDPVKDTDARVVEVRIQLDPEHNDRVSGLSYARVRVRISTAEGR